MAVKQKTAAKLIDSIISIPAEKMLFARMYDMGEQRIRTSGDFRITQKYENSKGVVLTLEEPRYGMLIRLRIEQDGEDVCLSVDPGWIIEYKSISYRLMELAVLPEFLETKVGSKGSYLVPVGAGLLADFRNRPHYFTRTRIYMDQAEWEKYSMMNCFGCMSKDKNYLCVVEEGDFFCYTEAEFNKDGKNEFCAVYQIRTKPGAMLRFEPLKLRIMQAKPGAEYDDLGKLYRRWFIEQKGVAPLRERAKNNPTLAYSIDALRFKVFMAQKYPYIPDGSNEVILHTSCAETEKILDATRKIGVEKAVVTLVGWNLGGHDGAYPSHFPIEPVIGGEPALRHLIEYAKNKFGYQIVPHDNWTDIYRNSPDFDYEYVARTESQEPVAAGVWGGGQAYKACPLVQMRRFGFEFERIHQLGFSGHYYMDAQSTAMWTCHSPHHPANEKEFALGLAGLTQVARNIYGAVATECCSAYTVPFVDETSTLVSDCMPQDMRDRDFYSVPFYHVALHGLIQYHVSGLQNKNWPEKGYLKEIAFGGKPTMEVSFRSNGGNGAFYKPCLERMKAAYPRCFKQLKYQMLLMETFKEPVRGVYFVTYDNGLSIAVNMTDKAYGKLAANSWKAERKG